MSCNAWTKRENDTVHIEHFYISIINVLIQISSATFQRSAHTLALGIYVTCIVVHDTRVSARRHIGRGQDARPVERCTDVTIVEVWVHIRGAGCTARGEAYRCNNRGGLCIVNEWPSMPSRWEDVYHNLWKKSVCRQGGGGVSIQYFLPSVWNDCELYIIFPLY